MMSTDTPGNGAETVTSAPHPRTIGWIGTTALAMGGSNQSLFLIGALIISQGSAAVPLLILGLLLSWAAAPGWTELILMWPNRVGGIAATCAEAFRPYSPVLANLTGVCYWWGWVPTCGLTAILSATAITEWYLPHVPVPLLATLLVLFFTAVNLCGVCWVTRLAIPCATTSALLAFLSGLIPIVTGHVNWHQAVNFHLIAPFPGFFGGLTSAMAGLYLVGFAAPAFEAATCHVGETINPACNVPRAVFASGFMATVYFAFLPVIWLGVLGPNPLTGDLAQTLGPTYGPWLGSLARAAAIWFMMFNMFHGTLQPLAGAARTLMQLAEDGLLPRVLALRSRTDTPWVATLLTAAMATIFLLTGDPTWVIAAANLTYLIGICLPNVAVWLLRRNEPHMERPYRAPRGTITLGLIASGVWGISTILGFEQFGLPTVLAGLALAYSGSVLYALRRWSDRRRAGERMSFHSLHLKLTGAMLLVLTLDGTGYLLAVTSINVQRTALITGLEDIFVAVALLTISVGLILPGMIGHAVGGVARAADRLANGTLADLSRAMQALQSGNLEEAEARIDISPIIVHSHDEVGTMATSFNIMQAEIGKAAASLYGAREGLRHARDELMASNTELQAAHEELARLAITDPLTGLPNHRAIIDQIEATLQRCQTTQQNCAIIFADVDHFKQINDTWGHGAGDVVLRYIGQQLQAHVRQEDYVGRYGGEEFAILLSDIEQEEARELAERLRCAIAEQPCVWKSEEMHSMIHIPVTASFGLAVYPLDGITRKALIETADAAMYCAKHSGRNRVCLPDEEIPEMPNTQVIGHLSQPRESDVVQVLSTAAQFHDQGTYAHSLRLLKWAEATTRFLGRSEEEVLLIRLAAQLHDIGKIGIPEAILHKPGPLTAEEWAVMRRHPGMSQQIITPAGGRFQLVSHIVVAHHERWDGQGYPYGLVHNEIPLGARILAVVDSYDAMTSARPYREALSREQAQKELVQGKGSQYDPEVVDAFLYVLQKQEPDTGIFRSFSAQA